MAIWDDIKTLEGNAIIELLEVDLTPLGDALYRLHDGKNELSNDIVWQGNTYSAFPYEATGFEISTQGTLPRPTLKIANVTGLFTLLAKNFDDFIGVKVTRKRTFAKYLDAVNFASGNPNADPNAHFPDDIYFIDRKSSEDRVFITFELASPIDLAGIRLPRRQIIQNSCTWKYRSAECTYAGGPVADINDQPTTDPTKDVCGKRLKSCKLRFGDSSELPYGGFPGAGLL